MAQQQTRIGKPRVTRLPLMGAYSNRGSSADKDQRFVNMFPETRKVDQLENTKIFINKRPGLTLYRDYGTGEGRGAAYFNGKFYVAVGNTVYEDAVSPVSKITLTGSTGHVGMIVANSSTLGDYLFVCDGTNAWTIETSGTVTSISDSGLYGVTITNAGAGYGAVPTITFGAPGSGATYTVSVTDGVVSAVDITAQGSAYTTATTVTFSAPVLTFDGSSGSVVSVANDTITLTGHTYGTGNAVTYSNGGGTSIGGLTTATKYYIIKVDANTIKLATSSANATAGTAINLTGLGVGTSHTLTGDTTATGSVIINSLPNPHVPAPVFIDGYIILAKKNSVDVYNCVLDDPHRWASDNYLSAEMFPDAVTALARQNNQVVVLGPTSIEFFYDAANAAGSPLSRNDSTTIQFGVSAYNAVYQNEKYCIVTAQSDSGGRGVWQIEGFQPKKVSDEYIDRIIDAESSIDTATGFGVRAKGHLFYVLNLPTVGRTLVYDVDEKLWHEWSSNSTGSHAVFQCNHMADNGTGAAYLLHNSNGCLYKFDPAANTDAGTAIISELVTNRYDMDSMARKFMHSAKIVGDRYTSNSVDLYWTDDDYQTWSGAKTISLSDDFPAFQRLGAFRRRAFKIKHSSDNPLRLESLEVTYTEGDT